MTKTEAIKDAIIRANNLGHPCSVIKTKGADRYNFVSGRPFAERGEDEPNYWFREPHHEKLHVQTVLPIHWDEDKEKIFPTMEDAVRNAVQYVGHLARGTVSESDRENPVGRNISECQRFFNWGTPKTLAGTNNDYWFVYYPLTGRSFMVRKATYIIVRELTSELMKNKKV